MTTTATPAAPRRPWLPFGRRPTREDLLFDAFISYSHAADGRLAPRIQQGLHRLARPLFRPRALRVFRDETGTSATPELWPSIQRALDRSRYFILMASPEAARSVWVGDEVDHWLTRSPAAREGTAAGRFLIVLTGGEIHWDREAGGFDPERTSALPTRLFRDVFAHEPLWVDLRDAKTQEDLSLQNPYFRGKVADLAATLHGKSKEELIGEDVRIARRTRRLAWTASLLLVALTAAAVAAARAAIVQRDEARSRGRAAQAVAGLDMDPRLSLQRAMEAVGIAETSDAVAALRESLVRSTLRAELVPDPGRIASAAFSPDGRLILTRVVVDGARAYLQLWDGTTGAAGCRIGGGTDGRFVKEGALVATADGRLLDARSCLPAPADTAVADTREAVEVAMEVWKEDPMLLFSPQEIREARTGRVLRRLPDGIEPVAGVAASAFGLRAVTWAAKDLFTESGGGSSAIGEKVARVWDLVDSQDSWHLTGHRLAINVAVFGAQDRIIATGSDDRTVRLWTANGEELAVLRGHTTAVEGVAVSPDGGYVASVSANGKARLWEPGTRLAKPARPAELFRLRYGVSLPRLGGAEKPLRVPALSGDRRRVVAWVGGLRYVTWDARTGAVVGRPLDLSTIADVPGPPPPGDLSGRLSPDGARLLVPLGSPDLTAGEPAALVVEVATGRVVGSLGGHVGPVYAAAYSPDGLRIATGGQDGKVRMWDARRLVLDTVLTAGATRVLHLAFSPDGGRLIASSRDALARIWDLRGGGAPLELFGHEAGVHHAFFSADGALVVSIGEADGTRVWDASTGKMLGRYMGDGADPAFISHDCAALVVGSRANDILEAHVHPFGACGPVNRMLVLARSRVRRSGR